MFRRFQRLPSTPLDYQARAFEDAESLIAGTPATQRERLRLRVYLLPTPECPADALRAWFIDGYAEGVAREWAKHLQRTGLDGDRPIHLTFQVADLDDPEIEERTREQFETRGVIAEVDRAEDRRAVLRLEVSDRELLERPSEAVVVRPGRIAYIGRQRVVKDTVGRVVRTNDLAFRDEPRLRSISRKQALIRYDIEQARFELIDGESQIQTQVLRHGQPVERMRPLPTPLKNGDVIRLPNDVEVQCLIEAI